MTEWLLKKNTFPQHLKPSWDSFQQVFAAAVLKLLLSNESKRGTQWEQRKNGKLWVFFLNESRERYIVNKW